MEFSEPFCLNKQMRHFHFKCVLICLNLFSLRWHQDNRFQWYKRSWNMGLILMGKLTPGWAAAPGRCVHRWQQRAAASTAHCHTHSHSHQRPAGTARSPQSHLCSTERENTYECTDSEVLEKRISMHYYLWKLIHSLESNVHAWPSPLLCKHWRFPRGRAEVTAFIKSSLCAQIPPTWIYGRMCLLRKRNK